MKLGDLRKEAEMRTFEFTVRRGMSHEEAEKFIEKSMKSYDEGVENVRNITKGGDKYEND